MLTTVLLLVTHQLVEVPLYKFKGFAEPRGIAAVALSPDAHVVSVWTRWSDQTPCIRWTVDVQTGATEGFGEDECPQPALPSGVSCDEKGCRLGKKPLGETALQGVPTRAQVAGHPVEPVIALNLERALTFVSLTDGHLISSFSHAGSALKGVAASEGEWLLWTQTHDGADHLYLADGAQLTAPTPERPFVRAVSRIRLPSSFGWKKDTRGTPDSPCDFFERGVMAEDDVLFLDWSADAKPFDVRVRGQGMFTSGKMEPLCPTGLIGNLRHRGDESATFSGSVPDALVADTLELKELTGIDAKVIHLAGHTSGSLVVVVGDVVLAGDLLRGSIVGSGAETHFYQCDLELNRKNVQRVLNELAPTAQTFFVGHFGPVSREAVQAQFK